MLELDGGIVRFKDSSARNRQTWHRDRSPHLIILTSMRSNEVGHPYALPSRPCLDRSRRHQRLVTNFLGTYGLFRCFSKNEKRCYCIFPYQVLHPILKTMNFEILEYVHNAYAYPLTCSQTGRENERCKDGGESQKA